MHLRRLPRSLGRLDALSGAGGGPAFRAAGGEGEEREAAARVAGEKAALRGGDPRAPRGGPGEAARPRKARGRTRGDKGQASRAVPRVPGEGGRVRRSPGCMPGAAGGEVPARNGGSKGKRAEYAFPDNRQQPQEGIGCEKQGDRDSKAGHHPGDSVLQSDA
jgi:hypothetical protein